jgi:hypothetical protein
MENPTNNEAADPRTVASSRHERRSAPRLRRRLTVEYGEGELLTPAFGLDISAGGIFLTASKLLPLGARIHLRVSSAALTFYSEGEVVRHKLVLPTLRSMDPQGIGVRFLTLPELVERYVAPARKALPPFSIACSTPSSVEDLIREQLARGVVIVPTRDPPPGADETIDFRIVLEFHSAPRTISGQGRVVQLLSQGASKARGAVLELEDTPALIAELRRAAA